jgi:hypothetical protein
LSVAWLLNRLTPARVAVVALAFAFVFSSGDVVSSAAVVIACLGFLAGHFRRLGAILVTPAVIFAMLLGFAMTAFVWLPWWENRQALAASPVKPPAKAWFVRNYKLYPTRDEARRAAANIDPKAIVLLDEQVAPDWQTAIGRLKADPPATRASGGFFSRRRSDVPINVTASTGGHWKIQLPDEDGWIVVGQAYTDGWAAKIMQVTRFGRSSQDIVTLPADGGLIAIPTHDQGVGDLYLDYRPPSWRQGAIVSAASGAVCLLLLGLSVSGKRTVNDSAAASGEYIGAPATAL